MAATSSPPGQRHAAQPVLGVAALASGAALAATILTHAPLAVTLAAFFGLATATSAIRLRRLAPAARRLVRNRAAVGMLAGISATLAYDLIRLALVTLFRLRVHPFEALPIFGQLIIGGDPGPAQWIVGTGYHYLNGVMFGVAYCLLLPGRNWAYGVVWALGLEAFMLMLYPGWLHLHDIVLQEFTVVSMSGHLAYGTTLGVIGQRRLGRDKIERGSPGVRPQQRLR